MPCHTPENPAQLWNAGLWAVLKEEIGTRFWTDRATARAGIFDFIETFYNRRRLRKHIHFGYLTPHETRLRYRQDQALAA
ncbi:IS3 family transposase [Streptomyces sp. NBC_01549]|uniref:IS3 family transposase n=1 Tax=Streptomyces sp. NBC_01549 TaxID=2975874 RepID=UPI00225B5D64|nr:IS3 family transposase [Streptomyces sp. NBC_01549]MCX4594814.1 IS3 family transposase [Streptomyces sp. NBC_01549]